jgi:hypothetical protein
VASISGSDSGLATETRTYSEDDPSNPNDTMRGDAESQTWMVMDQQTISFSGTLTAVGSTLTRVRSQKAAMPRYA